MIAQDNKYIKLIKKINMKILITGSAGFIGSKLVQELANKGHDIVGLDNINNYYDIKLKYGRLDTLTGIREKQIEEGLLTQSQTYHNYRFIKLDLQDKDNIEKLFNNEQFDVVCHLAAQAGVRYSITNPESYITSNIIGFFNILENCRHHKIKHLVYASSSSVYGMNSKVPFSEEDKTDQPVSLYAATKKSNELLAYSYSHLYGIATTALRFFTVYGPWGRPDMAPFLFTKAIKSNEPIKIFNNGNMVRDFTYIDDIVEGVINVVEQKPKQNESKSKPQYKIYNIGNSQPIKLMSFISTLEKELAQKAEKIFMPMQPGDVMQTNADVSNLEKDFNFKPTTPIEEGVSQFINWYKQFYK